MADEEELREFSGEYRPILLALELAISVTRPRFVDTRGRESARDERAAAARRIDLAEREAVIEIIASIPRAGAGR